MLDSPNLLADVIKILPEEVECFMQAPSLENEFIQSLMMDSEFDYFKIIKIDICNKEDIINQILTSPIIDYIQNIQIKAKGELLFEGFDGVEFGTLSKSIIVPEWFNEIYIITELCNISDVF